MMSLPVVEKDQFAQLILENIPIIDVRAPVEFRAGALPNSINIPILNDEERHEIGTIYKQRGQQAAVARGYELVSGAVKNARISQWKNALEKNPQTVVTCFRGGQRSQITQTWLREMGWDRPRLQGGYKAFRQFLMDEINRLSPREMCVISGATGSGKTLIIREALKFRPTIDLEGYANHRGSAFGGYPEGQPTQIDFENQLSAQLIRLEAARDPRPVVVEDESRLIGKCAQPEIFFQSLRSSGIALVEESLESRVQVTFGDYILNSPIGQGLSDRGLQTFQRYHKSLQAISRKLGGLRFAEIEKDLFQSLADYQRERLESNRVWISKLLEFYYDPLYLASLDKRAPQILFRGSRQAVVEWLQF